MKQNMNLVFKLILCYLSLLSLGFFLNSLLINFQFDQSIISVVFAWSATIFAPLVVLITYYNWKEQKSAEVIAVEAKHLAIKLINFREEMRNFFKYAKQTNLYPKTDKAIHLDDLDKHLAPFQQATQAYYLNSSELVSALIFIKHRNTCEKSKEFINNFIENKMFIEERLYSPKIYEIQKIEEKFFDNLDYLVDDMYDYALYKK